MTRYKIVTPLCSTHDTVNYLLFENYFGVLEEQVAAGVAWFDPGVQYKHYCEILTHTIELVPAKRRRVDTVAKQVHRVILQNLECIEQQKQGYQGVRQHLKITNAPVDYNTILQMIREKVTLSDLDLKFIMTLRLASS
jgi:hypothetical protein